MLGIGLAFLAGLIPAFILTSHTRGKVLIAIVVGVILFFWGRGNIAWDLQHSIPYLSHNAWTVAFMLAGFGAGLRFLDRGLVIKIVIPGLLLIGFLWGFDMLHKSGDPVLQDLSVAIPVQAALVGSGLYYLFIYQPTSKKKKEAAKKKDDHH